MVHTTDCQAMSQERARALYCASVARYERARDAWSALTPETDEATIARVQQALSYASASLQVAYERELSVRRALAQATS